MSNPTTFQGESGGSGALDWNDSAELLKKGDTGVGFEFMVIRRDTFADLIRFVLCLPADEQDRYVIQIRSRRYEGPDIRTLGARPDFPKR